MIEIVTRLDDKENIIHYLSSGHASSVKNSAQGNKGLSLSKITAIKVCSALSALEYQFLYSMKIMCSSLVLDSVIKDGYFEFSGEPLKESDDGFNRYLILSRSLMIGVEMLKQSYPELINVRISV